MKRKCATKSQELFGWRVATISFVLHISLCFINLVYVCEIVMRRLID